MIDRSHQQRMTVNKAAGKDAGKDAGKIIRDGDLVSTRVRFKTAGRNTANEVTVLSTIQAIASCRHTTVALDTGPDGPPDVFVSKMIPQHLTNFVVRVGAVDQDGLAMDHSSPQLTVTWDASNIEVRRRRQCPDGPCLPGLKHFFVAEIEKVKRQSLGPHRLAVVLNGLDEQVDGSLRMQSCTLLSITVNVTEQRCDAGTKLTETLMANLSAVHSCVKCDEGYGLTGQCHPCPRTAQCDSTGFGITAKPGLSITFIILINVVILVILINFSLVGLVKLLC